MGRYSIDYDDDYYETTPDGWRVKRSYKAKFTPPWLKILTILTIVVFVGYIIYTVTNRKDVTVFSTETPIVLTQKVKVESSVGDHINESDEVVEVHTYTFKINYANTELKDIENIVFALQIRDSTGRTEIITTEAQKVNSSERYYSTTIKKVTEAAMGYRVLKVAVSVNGETAYQPQVVNREFEGDFNPISIVIFMGLMVTFSILQSVYTVRGRLKMRAEQIDAREQVERQAQTRAKEQEIKNKKRVCSYCGQVNNGDAYKCEGCGASLKE